MLTQVLDRLWSDYIQQNPHAKKVFDLLTSEGEQIQNDHIAFRTFDHPSMDIEVMAKPLLELGYEPGDSYVFDQKKLIAKHFSHSNKSFPRVFISMLETKKFSSFLQDTVNDLASKFPKYLLGTNEMLFAGNQWKIPEYKTYQKLQEESDYAAWLYVNGFRPNHFTVSINALTKYTDIHKLNQFLKDNGFALNSANGEVKGSPDQMLEQSSTMAGKVGVDFVEGNKMIPACYYEFAKRYPDGNGDLYDGFIAQSADKIFESTNE